MQKNSLIARVLAVPLLLLAASLPLAAQTNYLLYTGTYTNGASKGIYAFRFDTSTGKSTPMGLAAALTNPSFVAIHPSNKFLYAVSETATWNGKPGGSVAAYSIDKNTGKLTLLNEVSTRGGVPCHLNVDKTGKSLVVANYGGGSVISYQIAADGKLTEASFIQHSGKSVDPKRQEGPHAHSANISPDNRFAIVADLGLDEVLVYKLDAAKGTLTPNNPPFAKVAPGSGPRHFSFHPSAKFAYVINEMGSTVTAFSWDAGKGVLKELQTISTLPEGYKGDTTTAEVLVHPSGKFVYGSNRGHDSIAVFTVDQAKGTLTAVGQTKTGGRTPRNFRIDPSGKFLLAGNSGNNEIVLFAIDQNSGKLTPTGEKIAVGSPVCMRFVPLP